MAADEQGAGVIGSLLGAGVFVLLMLFAVQVLVALYTKSVVTAATYDAAKSVAGADAGQGIGAMATAQAESNARAQLGDYGQRVAFSWSSDGDVVQLTARGPRPSFLPRALTGPLGLDDIERTVQVRKERLHAP